MMNRVAPEKRSISNAIYYNSYDVGICCGSILLGFITEKTSYTLMFRSASLSMLVFLAIYLFSVVRDKRIKIALQLLDCA